MEEWKQVAGRVQHMKICLIKAFRRTKKKKKRKRGETFSTVACLNRLRSAEHKPDLKN